MEWASLTLGPKDPHFYSLHVFLNLINELSLIYSFPQIRKIIAIPFLASLASSHEYDNLIFLTNIFKSLFLSSPPLSLVLYYLPLFFPFFLFTLPIIFIIPPAECTR